MKKIVLNSCFGGFSLSEEAQQWMFDHGAQHVCVRGQDLEFRSDPLLVQCVEELGEKADGMCADLRIEEYDDREYSVDYIEEYDGQESAVYVPVIRKDRLSDFMDTHDLEGLVSYLSEKDVSVKSLTAEQRVDSLCEGLGLSEEQKEQILLAVEHRLPDERIREDLLDDRPDAETMERRRVFDEHQQEMGVGKEENEKTDSEQKTFVYQSVVFYDPQVEPYHTFENTYRVPGDKDFSLEETLKKAALDYFSTPEGYEEMVKRHGDKDGNVRGISGEDVFYMPGLSQYGIERVGAVPTVYLDTGFFISGEELAKAVQERTEQEPDIGE